MPTKRKHTARKPATAAAGSFISVDVSAETWAGICEAARLSGLPTSEIALQALKEGIGIMVAQENRRQAWASRERKEAAPQMRANH